MPTYTFHCPECGKDIDRYMLARDYELPLCPRCFTIMLRRFQPTPAIYTYRITDQILDGEI